MDYHFSILMIYLVIKVYWPGYCSFTGIWYLVGLNMLILGGFFGCTAKVISDRDSGRSRGFGFVNFSSEDSAQTAMSAMDGQELNGRSIRVNFANERPSGTRYGGGDGDGGYSGGGGGGGYRGNQGGYGNDNEGSSY